MVGVIPPHERPAMVPSGSCHCPAVSRPLLLWGLSVVLLGCSSLSPPPGAAQEAGARDWEQALARPECQALRASRSQLQALQGQLHGQGLQLRLLGCPRQGGRPVLAVAVSVLDGEKAVDVVRGPLADGEDVDMGTLPSPAAAAGVVAEDAVSPDVAYNRQWLRGVMGRQGFADAGGAWWGYVPARR